MNTRMHMQGSTLVGQVIDVCEGAFTNCVFDRCVMRFSAIGDVGLDGCQFHGCGWEFVGPAAATIAFMTAMYGQEGGDLIVRDLIHKITGGDMGTKLPQGPKPTYN